MKGKHLAAYKKRLTREGRRRSMLSGRSSRYEEAQEVYRPHRSVSDGRG